MTNILKISVLATMLFCSTTFLFAQSDDMASRLRNNIVEALLADDCERAQRNYNIWKDITGETMPNIETEIRNCLRKTATPDSGFVVIPVINIAVQNKDISGVVLSYKDAENLCKNSILGGFTNWRLPTSNELSTIYSFSPSIMNRGFYWSSTKHSSSTTSSDLYNVVNFVDGTIVGRATASLARCVRTVR